MIKMALGEDSMSCTQVSELFRYFKEGRISAESVAKFEARQNGYSQFSYIKMVLCLMSSLQRVKN